MGITFPGPFVVVGVLPHFPSQFGKFVTLGFIVVVVVYGCWRVAVFLTLLFADGKKAMRCLMAVYFYRIQKRFDLSH